MEDHVFAANVSVIQTPPTGNWGFPIRSVPEKAKTVGNKGAWPHTHSHARMPPGLDVLTGMSQLKIEQEMDLAETTLGRELPNKYHIKDVNGDELYMAAEMGTATGGSLRPFEIRLYNNVQHEVMRLSRPLRCSCCCFPCAFCLQNLLVTAPPGNPIGRVVETWAPLGTRLSLQNSNQACVLRVHGPLCGCCSWRNVNYKVLAPDSDSNVGNIKKEWAGFMQESLTDADNFHVTFPAELDVITKALLLAATFLIDFMFFESSPERKNRRHRSRQIRL